MPAFSAISRVEPAAPSRTKTVRATASKRSSSMILGRPMQGLVSEDSLMSQDDGSVSDRRGVATPARDMSPGVERGMSQTETIFALSSGPPPAGVAIVRISGPGVRFGLETLIDSIPEPRLATLRSIHARSGEVIDRGLVLFFPEPASFTGEDVAEFHLHGGLAVVAAVLAQLGALPGFPPAEAGEVTRRALPNQRMDLTPVDGL